MTVSTQPLLNYRPTSAERHAAQVSLLATRQAELKQQAADRRTARASQDASAPRKPPVA
jgi:hypothetical protein